MLQIPVSELTGNAEKYIAMLVDQDILITWNEKPVARLTPVKENSITEEMKMERMSAAKALFGILPSDIDLDQMREERLCGMLFSGKRRFYRNQRSGIFGG